MSLASSVGIATLNAGLFVRGEPERHARRVIDSHEIVLVDRAPAGDQSLCKAREMQR